MIKLLTLVLLSLGIPLISFLGTEGLTHESKDSKEQLEEIEKLENEIFSLKTGEIVIQVDEVLGSTTFQYKNQDQLDQEIEELLKDSNSYAFSKIKPKEEPKTRVLLIRGDHIKDMKELISQKGKWEVKIISSGNYILGEDYVYGYPEVLSK